MLGYSLLGLVLILAGIIATVLAAAISSREAHQDTSSVKAAGVIMIGPIPIIFGTDTKWLIVAIVLAIVLLALGILTSLR